MEYSSSLPFSNPLTSQTTLFASQQMENIVASVRASLDSAVRSHHFDHCWLRAQGRLCWLVDSRRPLWEEARSDTRSSPRPHRPHLTSPHVSSDSDERFTSVWTSAFSC